MELVVPTSATAGYRDEDMHVLDQSARADIV
jgi:hypothetical protein